MNPNDTKLDEILSNFSYEMYLINERDLSDDDETKEIDRLYEIYTKELIKWRNDWAGQYGVRVSIQELEDFEDNNPAIHERLEELRDMLKETNNG